MHSDGFDDELWDEHQWEAHLDEVERKSDQLRKFISSDPKGNLPRWLTILKESVNEDDAFEAYVEEELLLDEAYFPEDEDWEDEDDYEDEDFLFGEFDDLADLNDEEDDFEEGEEWKLLTEDYATSDNGNIEHLTIFYNAKSLAIDVLKWAEQVPAKDQTPQLHECVGDALKIGAKLAGGYSFGFDTEFLGANIAYTKKALACANVCLAILPQLKNEAYFTTESYQELYNRLFELRNDIGIYVQELRDRFMHGL